MCGCTSTCFADRFEQFKHHHFWRLEQSSCSWGQRAEQEKQRGDPFNWRVPWFLAFYSPANGCIQADREWELSKTSIHVTTALLWVNVSAHPQKHHWGWVSDTQTAESFECIGVSNQPRPSQVPQLQNPKANPKEVTWAKHCTVTTIRGPYNHQSKHRMVKTATSCCDFYTRVFKHQLLPLWLWKCFTEENSKKKPFAGKHPTRSFRGWPSHEHQTGSGNFQNHFKFSFLYLGRNSLQAASLVRTANISLKRKSLN